MQVNGPVEWQVGAVCKTVGSAYVGSNPTPATRFRRSKPVTLDCVTGFSRERERLRRPSAVSVGYAWAGSGRRPASGRLRLKCLLNCGNARMSGGLHVVLRGLPGRACVGYARDFGLVRVQIADRV